MKTIRCTEYRAFVVQDRLVLRWIRSWAERGELEPKRPERAFAERLEAQRRAGEIISWRFEAQKFRLTSTSDRTWYTPDFKVLYADGRQEFVEVKGCHIWDDGLLKFKIARSQFPEYVWSLWQRRKTQWVRLK